MKRKDWIIKNLKKDIFDKKIRGIKKKQSTKIICFFLRNLYLKRSKHLIRKNLFTNYFFLRSMLNTFNLNKKNYSNLVFFNKKVRKIPFYPQFSISKNVFNKKNKTLNILKKNNLNYFFLNNKYNRFNIGLSYYFVGEDNIIKSIKSEFNDEDNRDLIQFKDFNECFFEKELFFLNEVNLNLNLNLSFLCILEFYKINILLYLYKTN